MKTEVQIHYISPVNNKEKFLSIRLKNLDITAIEETIKERLSTMYPMEDTVSYKIIGIS